MTTYEHHLSGIFVKREEAEIAREKLLARGLDDSRIHIFTNDPLALKPATDESSNRVLKDMLVDGAIGTGVGTALGALGELALVAANVTLFVASPLIAPLVMLGWGASLGAVVGAVRGAVNKDPKVSRFSELVSDAIAGGQVVLVVSTLSEEETHMVSNILQAAIGTFRDEATAASA